MVQLRKILAVALAAATIVATMVNADLYLHNPRGSNDKLNEASNTRNNGNRLFDSQDNDNGGYNVGNLYYYTGSELQVEFTAQHGAENPIINNEFILQYSCDKQMPGLRDGTTTNTIPVDPVHSNDLKYGQHETYSYYQRCMTRQRNMGLFTADQLDPQNTNTNYAIFTRQNNNGQRYGFECQEERDYYPYWQPSPWIDLAIMTSNIDRCSYYQNQSQNVSPRGQCSVAFYNNQAQCTSNGGEWSIVPAWNVSAPVCVPSCFQRDNHLGNTPGAYAQFCRINITIPNTPSDRCVLRMRYNVSSADFDGWNVYASNNTSPAGTNPLVAAVYPSGSGVVYWLENQQIDIGIGVPLQMNINTNQFSRTFQDRSHYFGIKSRPPGISSSAYIHNLNVRGRRGNIVQVYPSVEYDFVPTILQPYKGEYIHLQWTGSNTNDNGNNGEGTTGTDRSNFVQVRGPNSNFPLHLANTTLWDNATMTTLALLNPPQYGGSTSTLDDAGTYFDAGLLQVTGSGNYYYISTRNNNFSNRDQKGVIQVQSGSRNGVSASTILAAVLVPTAAAVVAVFVVAAVGVVLFVALHAPTRRVVFHKCMKTEA